MVAEKHSAGNSVVQGPTLPMAKPLAVEFLTHAGPAATELRAWPELEATLQRHLRDARERWPALTVPPSDFLRHLAGRLGPEPVRALQTLHGADLYLALGCQLGLTDALVAFDAQFLSQVARHLGTARDEQLADEVKQLLRVRLLVASAGGRSLISTYSGRGPLGGFVRVAAVRLARDEQRGAGTKASSQDPLEGEGELPHGSHDPEMAYLKKRYAADLRRALSTTLTSLPDEDRNILSLHLFDGLTTEAIGALFRVDGSTIRRRVARMRQTILDETRRLLTARLRLEPNEFDSLVQLVRSELDLSIRRYLKR